MTLVHIIRAKMFKFLLKHYVAKELMTFSKEALLFSVSFHAANYASCLFLQRDKHREMF